ncbi:MAG TPA: hypothetical protein DCX14_08350 [Flavobacteriales bacterium]|nr:hypothetical protein [Flavobacteriales bacterium]
MGEWADYKAKKVTSTNKKLIKRIKIADKEKSSDALSSLEGQVDLAYEESMSETHKQGYKNLKRMIEILRNSEGED